MLAVMGGINPRLLLRRNYAGSELFQKNYSKLPVTPWKPFMACFQSHFMTRAAL
jgi:hypothetical protein